MCSSVAECGGGSMGGVVLSQCGLLGASGVCCHHPGPIIVSGSPHLSSVSADGMREKFNHSSFIYILVKFGDHICNVWGT